jgi:hypothetical protein
MTKIALIKQNKAKHFFLKNKIKKGVQRQNKKKKRFLLQGKKKSFVEREKKKFLFIIFKFIGAPLSY